MDSEPNSYVKKNLARNDLNYIVSIRRRLRKLGWLTWIVIGILAILYWEGIGLGGLILIVIAGVAVGGITSFIVSRRVTKRTGLGINDQIYVWRMYKQHGEDFFEANDTDSRQATAERDSTGSMDWETFLAVYLTFLAVGAFFVADGHCLILDSCQIWEVWSNPNNSAVLLGQTIGMVLSLIAMGFGIGILFWGLGSLVKSNRPSFLKTVLYTHIFIMVLISLGNIARPFNESVRRDQTDGNSAEEVRESLPEEEEERETLSVEELEKKLPDEEWAHTVGKPGGRIRTQMETALWEKPNDDDATLIEWIPEDTWLRNARKVGNFYKVVHQEARGYVRREQIVPNHRF